MLFYPHTDPMAEDESFIGSKNLSTVIIWLLSYADTGATPKKPCLKIKTRILKYVQRNKKNYV